MHKMSKIVNLNVYFSGPSAIGTLRTAIWPLVL